MNSVFKPSKTLNTTIVLQFLISAILALALHVEFFVFELIVSFLPQILIFSTGVYFGVFAFILKRAISLSWREAVKPSKTSLTLVGLALILNMYALAVGNLGRIYAQQHQGLVGVNLKIGSFNKLINNDNYDQPVNFFKVNKADVVVIQEVSETEFTDIGQRLGVSYGYLSDCDCSAADTEVGILSRFPIEQADVAFNSEIGAIVSAIITKGEERIRVFGVHLSPPYHNSWYQNRNEMFDRLEQLSKSETLPVLIAGDFNTTMYSPSLRSFSNEIKDVAKNAIDAGWPKCTWSYFSDALCLRLDYIFISNQYDLDSFVIGQSGGSDHQPILASIDYRD